MNNLFYHRSVHMPQDWHFGITIHLFYIFRKLFKISNHSLIAVLKPSSECSPVKRFGFLKTHKCGSTTIQNILFRYVVKQGLRVVLPQKGEIGIHNSLIINLRSSYFMKATRSISIQRKLQTSIDPLYTRVRATVSSVYIQSGTRLVLVSSSGTEGTMLSTSPLWGIP